MNNQNKMNKEFVISLKNELRNYSFPRKIGIVEGGDVNPKKVSSIDQLIIIVGNLISANYNSFVEFAEEIDSWLGSGDGKISKNMQGLAKEIYYESTSGMVIGLGEDIAIELDLDLDENIEIKMKLSVREKLRNLIREEYRRIHK